MINKDQDIVSTIITLARNLNLLTIAEGVETKAQLEFLKQHQCDIAQGYYYKPLETVVYTSWIQNGKTDLDRFGEKFTFRSLLLHLTKNNLYL